MTIPAVKIKVNFPVKLKRNDWFFYKGKWYTVRRVYVSKKD